MHSFPGFSRLRMHTKGGSPVAFVEYQDVRYAAQAMATLQGSFLLSSDRGAIRIEYAKSKMAEVGFTNLWIEVGFILCYASRIQDTVSTKRNPDENAASLCDTFTPDICIYIYIILSRFSYLVSYHHRRSFLRVITIHIRTYFFPLPFLSRSSLDRGRH